MKRILLLPATRVWILLMCLTIVSYLLVERGVSPPIAATAAMLIAAVKVRFVFIHFMELGWNVRPWRFLYECWVLMVTIIIIGGYWFTELNI